MLAYPHFIEKIISTKELELVLKTNSHLKIEQFKEYLHLYIALRENLKSDCYYMEPIKDGVKLSVPGIGYMRVCLWNEEREKFLLNKNKSIYKFVVDDEHNTKRFTTIFNLYKHKDIYLPQKNKNIQKVIRSPKNTSNMTVYDERYVIAAIRTTINFNVRKVEYLD